MAILKFYNGSTWDDPLVKFYNGSTWDTPLPKFYNGSIWVDLAPSGPVVSWNGQDNDLFRSGAVCTTGWRLHSDGDKYLSNNVGTYGSSYGTWLTSGLNSEVWVERTINSGTLTVDDIGSSRVACTSTYDMECVDVTDNEIPVTANVTIDFYDAASGGNLLATGALTLSAERI